MSRPIPIGRRDAPPIEKFRFLTVWVRMDADSGDHLRDGKKRASKWFEDLSEAERDEIWEMIDHASHADFVRWREAKREARA